MKNSCIKALHCSIVCQICLHPGIGILGKCLSDATPDRMCSDVPDLDDCFVTGHPVRNFLDWGRIRMSWRFTRPQLIL